MPDEKIYQILYCSRNRIPGTAAETRPEVEGILKASRRNNAEAGITGALFYNTLFFAQVLEGRFVDVQATFERLQLDPRHEDLVVLRSGYVAHRDFGDWSMAYAGASASVALSLSKPLSQPSMNELKADEISSFLREVVVQQEDWALPARTPVPR